MNYIFEFQTYKYWKLWYFRFIVFFGNYGVILAKEMGDTRIEFYFVFGSLTKTFGIKNKVSRIKRLDKIYYTNHSQNSF